MLFCSADKLRTAGVIRAAHFGQDTMVNIDLPSLKMKPQTWLIAYVNGLIRTIFK